MSKFEFATEVAQIVNGEVKNVEKANGVILTAILVPTEKDGVYAQIYTDQWFDAGLSVEDVVEKINAAAKHSPKFDLSFLDDFSKVSKMLRARLYNEKTRADVFKSASEYGFNDLIITAHIEEVTSNGSIRVTKELCDKWNKTPDEIFAIAERNSRSDATLEDMADVLKQMGVSDGLIGENSVPRMIVLSNHKKTFGAYSVIARLDELKELYPDGFIVLPSSVHEVIVVDAPDSNDLDDMVQNVNDTQVDLTDQLSNHAYRIA